MAKIIRRFRKRIIKPADCYFCKQDLEPEYKKIETLSRFISERGKIIGRIYSGICQSHQHQLAREIKRARFLAILPYIVRPS